jgi:hypothetical protein
MAASEPDRRGAQVVREDVHIHAALPEVHRHVSDPNALATVLSHHFRDVEADDDSLAFTLALPMRREDARLLREGSEQRAVTYTRDGSGSVRSVTLAIHMESTRESHLTIEVIYEPQRGAAGVLLETLFHRPHRTQALRDSLWTLKHQIEGSRNGHEQ